MNDPRLAAEFSSESTAPPVRRVRDLVEIAPCHGGEECVERREQFRTSMLGRYVGIGVPGPDQAVAAVVPVVDADAAALAGRTNQFSRRAARKAERLGYEVRAIDPRAHLSDIVVVNHSLDERCGKPMSPAYRRSLAEIETEAGTSIKFASPSCDRHWDRWRGVFAAGGGSLIGYARLRRHDDYLLYAQWLGHGDHLDQGVMHLLHHDILRWVTGDDPAIADLRMLVYAAWLSGGEGLRFWKRASGFEPALLVLDPEGGDA